MKNNKTSKLKWLYSEKHLNKKDTVDRKQNKLDYDIIDSTLQDIIGNIQAENLYTLNQNSFKRISKIINECSNLSTCNFDQHNTFSLYPYFLQINSKYFVPGVQKLIFESLKKIGYQHKVQFSNVIDLTLRISFTDSMENPITSVIDILSTYPKCYHKPLYFTHRGLLDIIKESCKAIDSIYCIPSSHYIDNLESLQKHYGITIDTFIKPEAINFILIELSKKLSLSFTEEQRNSISKEVNSNIDKLPDSICNVLGIKVPDTTPYVDPFTLINARKFDEITNTLGVTPNCTKFSINDKANKFDELKELFY